MAIVSISYAVIFYTDEEKTLQFFLAGFCVFVKRNRAGMR